MTNDRNPRVGILFEGSSPYNAGVSITERAAIAERAGFDTIWVSDHIVMPSQWETLYPFSTTGTAPWSPTDPWYDPLILLTAIAASTNRIEIGTNAMVVGLRHPLQLAKQIATLDQVCRGRFVLGAGAGWLLEEFEALGIPTAHRGARLDEWLQVLRSAWTGEIKSFNGSHYSLDRDVNVVPTPARSVPVLVAGMSRAALHRVARNEAGWIAEVPNSKDPVPVIEDGISQIRKLDERMGLRPDRPLRVVYNANEPLKVLADRARDLGRAGVTDVVLSIDVSDADATAEAVDRLKALWPA